jgi:hypothetical protein
MSTDTPRTDEAVIDNGDLFDEGYGPSPYAYADFARQLERELAAEQEKVKRLERDKRECLAAIEYAITMEESAAIFLGDWTHGDVTDWDSWPQFYGEAK